MAQRRGVFVRLDADVRTARFAPGRVPSDAAPAPRSRAVLRDALGRADRFAAGTYAGRGPRRDEPVPGQTRWRIEYERPRRSAGERGRERLQVHVVRVPRLVGSLLLVFVRLWSRR